MQCAHTCTHIHMCQRAYVDAFLFYISIAWNIMHLLIFIAEKCDDFSAMTTKTSHFHCLGVVGLFCSCFSLSLFSSFFIVCHFLDFSSSAVLAFLFSRFVHFTCESRFSFAQCFSLPFFSFICFVYAAVAQILDCLRNETKPTCVFTLLFFLRSFFLFFVIVRLLVFPLTTSLCRFASSFAVTAAHFFACRACECLCVFLRFFSIVRFLLRFSFKQKMQWTKSTTNKTSSHTRVQFSRSRDRFIKRVWINVPCYFRYFATCSTPSNGFRFLSLVLSSSLRTFESRCKCEKVKPMGCSHISSTRCNFVL